MEAKDMVVGGIYRLGDKSGSGDFYIIKVTKIVNITIYFKLLEDETKTYSNDTIYNFQNKSGFFERHDISAIEVPINLDEINGELRPKDMKAGETYLLEPKTDAKSNTWYELEVNKNTNGMIDGKIINSNDEDAVNTPIRLKHTSKVFEVRNIYPMGEESIKIESMQVEMKKVTKKTDKVEKRSPEDERILNKLFIDLALQTGDEKWFNQLTKKEVSA